MACLIFTAKSSPPVEMFCRPPADISIAENSTNLWLKAAHKEIFNRVENEVAYDICNVYKNATERFLQNVFEPSTETIPCSDFVHEPTYVSIVHRYDLICSRQWLVPLTQSFHLLGVLIGGLVANQLLKT
jgi:hypothetical protein